VSHTELETALRLAREALSSIKRQRGNEIADAIADVSERIGAKYADQHDGAVAACNAAEKALRDAKDADAAAGIGALLPVGEVYEELDFPGGRYPYGCKLERTGKLAVIELFRTGDDYLGVGRMPEPGATVLRELKKNGKRGMRCYRVRLGFDGKPGVPFGWRKREAAP